MGALRRWAALFCVLVAACGNQPPVEPSAPATDTRRFDPAAAYADRPCTVLTAEDAVALTGRRYFETIARNEVLGDSVRCSIGVGEGGLSATVELHVLHPLGQPAELLRAACASGAAQAPLPAPACITKAKSYAVVAGAHVMIAKVSGATGKTDQARSLRLASMMLPRLAILPQ